MSPPRFNYNTQNAKYSWICDSLDYLFTARWKTVDTVVIILVFFIFSQTKFETMLWLWKSTISWWNRKTGGKHIFKTCCKLRFTAVCLEVIKGSPEPDKCVIGKKKLVVPLSLIYWYQKPKLLHSMHACVKDSSHWNTWKIVRDLFSYHDDVMLSSDHPKYSFALLSVYK